MTLLELSAQYEKSAQLLRVRLSELRRQKKTAEDRQELFWLELAHGRAVADAAADERAGRAHRALL